MAEGVKKCVVCDDAIWYREGHLCQKHRFEHVHLALSTQWFDLRLKIREGKKSDFYHGLNHHQAQTKFLSVRPTAWHVLVNDVMRMHGHWLDDYGGCAA